MGEVRAKVRYYEVRNGRGFWAPRGWVKELPGFESRPLGTDGPAAWRKAEALYKQALECRAKGDIPAPQYKRGSLGAFFKEWTMSRTFTRKAPRTREEYWTAWLRIGPVFGNALFSSITVAQIEAFYDGLERDHTPKVRHRAIAKLSSILKQAVAHGLIKHNPVSAIRNEKPKPRNQLWLPQEIEKLIGTAEHIEFDGVAIALRLIYECGFSPVDARMVCSKEIKRDNAGPYLDLSRKKSGAEGVWPISEGLFDALNAYRDGLGADLLDTAPILRRPDGQPWRDENHFSKDFARVRREAFDKDEKRRAMDIRRTYNIEMDLGGAAPEERALMMANGLDKDAGLDAVYTPLTLEKARQAHKKRDEGRAIRRQIGEQKPDTIPNIRKKTR